MKFMDAAREQGLPVKIMYSMREVAQVVGVSVDAVREAARSGALETAFRGRRTCASPESVERWLEESSGSRLR